MICWEGDACERVRLALKARVEGEDLGGQKRRRQSSYKAGVWKQDKDMEAELCGQLAEPQGVRGRGGGGDEQTFLRRQWPSDGHFARPRL